MIYLDIFIIKLMHTIILNKIDKYKYIHIYQLSINHLIPNKKWLNELKIPIVATVPPTIARICRISS